MPSKAPAIRIPLPGGAVLTRPAGQPGGPLTCSRCGATSGPARIDRDHDTTTEIAAWSAKHRGGECES